MALLGKTFRGFAIVKRGPIVLNLSNVVAAAADGAVVVANRGLRGRIPRATP